MDFRNPGLRKEWVGGFRECNFTMAEFVFFIAESLVHTAGLVNKEASHKYLPDE